MPGQDSFTSALIWALESLVKEKEDGRFTTVELRNKIMDAPDFPEDQDPVLFHREKESPTGRIMLHPLQRQGSDTRLSPKEAACLDPFKRHTLTLHFDFGANPSQTYIETLGRELNDIFRRNVGVSRVRWGGKRQSMVARAAKTFQASLKRSRRASMRLQQATSAANFSDTKLSENALEPLTPSSSDQHSPRITEPAANGSPLLNPADISAMLLPMPLDPNDEDEGQAQEPRGRRKRRRIALHSESP